MNFQDQLQPKLLFSSPSCGAMGVPARPKPIELSSIQSISLKSATSSPTTPRRTVFSPAPCFRNFRRSTIYVHCWFFVALEFGIRLIFDWLNLIKLRVEIKLSLSDWQLLAPVSTSCFIGFNDLMCTYPTYPTTSALHFLLLSLVVLFVPFASILFVRTRWSAKSFLVGKRLIS